MVVTPRRGREAVRSVVVPDPEHWTLNGVDVQSLGYVRADAPEHAELILVPNRIPEALEAAVLDAWSRLPEPRRFVPLEDDFEGVPAGVLLGEGHAAGTSPGAPVDHHAPGDEGGAEPDHDMEGHDHDDMMAIVGDPSSDGLVMESIDFELGPLSSALPGGLVAEISLDGDVVESCTLRPTLSVPRSRAGAASAGPGAVAALEAAIATARERTAGMATGPVVARSRVAAIELERALGHATWFRGFGVVLGWAQLADRAQAVVDALLEPRRLAAESPGNPALRDGRPEWSEALPGAEKAAEAVLGLLDGSRRLRARAGGRARTPPADLAAQIGGPVARAAGLPRDARIGDPLYEELGFEPQREEAGDAAARALVRAREMRLGVALAAAAASEPAASGARPATDASDAVTVESARGPLRVAIERERDSALVTAPGAPEALELAGESVRGLELASALTAISSFDLSPWRVER